MARIEAGQAALTKCYEAAHDGQTVSLESLIESVGDARGLSGAIVSNVR